MAIRSEGFLETLVNADPFESPAETFVSDEGVSNARGRVLGGTSAINAGFYSRAHPEFFNESGVNWDPRLVQDSCGWSKILTLEQPEWQSAVRDGLIAAGVTPFNGYTTAHVEGTKIGGSTFGAGRRRHTAADLLQFANDNLKVATRAIVERVLFNYSGPYRQNQQLYAIGVVYRDRNGFHHHAMTRSGGEINLAGALGSPQLLLLSGIGPRAYLSSWGIPVAVPNPSQYLHDNPRNGLSIIPSGPPLEHSLIQVVGITGNGTFLEAATNVVSYRSPRLSPLIPATPLCFTVATIISKVMGPASVGSLDVRDVPLVRFNLKVATRAIVERVLFNYSGPHLQKQQLDALTRSGDNAMTRSGGSAKGQECNERKPAAGGPNGMINQPAKAEGTTSGGGAGDQGGGSGLGGRRVLPPPPLCELCISENRMRAALRMAQPCGHALCLLCWHSACPHGSGLPGEGICDLTRCAKCEEAATDYTPFFGVAYLPHEYLWEGAYRSLHIPQEESSSSSSETDSDVDQDTTDF